MIVFNFKVQMGKKEVVTCGRKMRNMNVTWSAGFCSFLRWLNWTELARSSPADSKFPVQAPVLTPVQPRCFQIFLMASELTACWCPPGGLSKISSDPGKLVNDAVEESTHLIGAVLKFAANLIAPEEDQGSVGLPVYNPIDYYHMHDAILTRESKYLLP